MPKPFDIRRNAYNMASKDGESAEIQLYGDVVETWPVDWWTGEKVSGDYIAQDEFLRDLEAVKDCKNVTVRINSYGGDTVVGMTIHNRLRELARDGVALTAIVDGVAMSAASVIMCACDTVKINPTGLVMIHKNSVIMWGFYNADEMRSTANTLDSYDRAIIEAYKRKTGRSEAEIAGMLAETTYMTGKEAVERGFADELIEDAQNLNIAASADGTKLIINGKRITLPQGKFAPDFIPTEDKAEIPENAAPEAEKPADEANTAAENAAERGNKTMTAEELRQSYPEAVAQIETAAASAAVASERARMQDIDEIAPLYSEQLVHDAKYGEKPQTAAELALAAAKQQRAQGSAFLSNLEADSKESKVSDVGAANSANSEDALNEEHTTESVEAAGRQAAQDFLKKRKEGK